MEKISKIELARLIAKRTKPRFVEIPRVSRYTAAENTMKALAKKWNQATTDCLEAEQRRLIKNWEAWEKKRLANSKRGS